MVISCWKWQCSRVSKSMTEWSDGGKRYWVKCKEAERGMHTSVWIPICLRRAASGRVYQSFPIIYIQLLISLHLNWEWERVCSFALGRVTVEKLSVQAKYMAVLMYTFGVFVQSGGLRINVCVLFTGALTDANLSVVLGREGILFIFFENIYPAFSHFLASWRILYHSISTVSCQKKNLLCILCDFEKY